jgi:hypothetical protein
MNSFGNILVFICKRCPICDSWFLFVNAFFFFQNVIKVLLSFLCYGLFAKDYKLLVVLAIQLLTLFWLIAEKARAE